MFLSRNLKVCSDHWIFGASSFKHQKSRNRPHEHHFKNLLEKASTNNARLKYVAELKNGRASVGLKEIDANHDFFNLEGSDNIILFYTTRYKQQPLIVKGAGAGAEVTAGGIFGDIIRIGKT